MGATKTQLSAYREAFSQFKFEAHLLADINSRRQYDASAAELAMLRVEQARRNYNQKRDQLASLLMSENDRRAFWTIPETDRVKDIAELFWVMAGRPHGTAEDDWYRAERVVRHSYETMCCAR